MPTLARISTTPLKSTALHHPGRIVLGPRGVAENRRFFMVDATGRLLGPIRHPGLVRLNAAYDPVRERLAVTFPGGAVVEGDALALGARVVVDFWGRPTPGRLVEGALAGALGMFLEAPVRLLRADEDGGGSDDLPVTLVARASIAELGRHAGRVDVDGRRFRMLLEVDGARPHEEDGWAGRRVRVGEAVLRVGGPVPRCAVTTLDPATGRRDLDTLRVIDGYRGRGSARTLDFGMYAEVVVPGAVAVGDAVEPLEG